MTENKSNIKNQSDPQKRLIAKLNVAGSEIPIFMGKTTELRLWI